MKIGGECDIILIYQKNKAYDLKGIYKMKSKILKAALAVILILTMVASFSSCAPSTLPEAESASGKIEGSDIVWSYNADTKTLDIDGAGAIPNFESSTAVPWTAVRHSAHRVEIGEGITAIGDYSLYFFTSLEELKLPTTVTSIGNYGLAFCSALTSITVPDTVTSLGDSCFEGCAALTSVFVPYATTSIGARAFFACGALKSAIIMAQISEIKSETFTLCRSLETLCFNESLRGLSSIADNAFDEAKINFSGATFTTSTTGAATLTVKYVKEDGSPAAPDYTAEFSHGATYTVESPKIEGFTADQLTVTGSIGADTTITVTYKADAPADDAPVTPEPETPTEDEGGKEDEQEKITVGTIIALVILGVVIVGIAVLAVIMVKSDKKTAQNTKAKNAKPTQSNTKNKKK